MHELSRASGLSADVIRAWERRYGALSPLRDSNNHRRYTDGDLRRLLALRDAVASGHAISQVAALDDEALAGLSRRSAGAGEPEILTNLLLNVRAHDALALEAGLADAFAVMRVEDFCDRIAAPLLEEVGAYWLRDPSLIAKEHLATCAVESILDAAMIRWAPRRGPLLVFAILAHERHAAGPKMAAAVAASRGFRTLVLGAGSTPGEIADVAERLGSAGVGVSVVYHDAEHTLRELAKRLRIPLWAGGRRAPLGPWVRVASMAAFAPLLDAI